jgi:hypothetical protein
MEKRAVLKLDYRLSPIKVAVSARKQFSPIFGSFPFNDFISATI